MCWKSRLDELNNIEQELHAVDLFTEQLGWGLWVGDGGWQGGKFNLSCITNFN